MYSRETAKICLSKRVKSEILYVGQMLDPCSSRPRLPWFFTSLHPLNEEQIDIAGFQEPETMLTYLVNLWNPSQVVTKSMYVHSFFFQLESPQHHPRSHHQVHQVNTSIILKLFSSRTQQISAYRKGQNNSGRVLDRYIIQQVIQQLSL